MWQTDAKGQTISHSYDANSNLTGIWVPGQAAVAFTYDALDRRATMTDSFGVTSWSYDRANKVTVS